VAGALTVISIWLVSPLLGPHWVTDYLRLIRSYNRIDAGPVFAFSIVPELMGNLRAILSVDFALRDDISSLISAAVWFIALVSVSIAGLRSRVSAPALWAMSILSYLLFCPHVTSTEELQLLVIFSMCVPPDKKLARRELLLFFSLPLLVFITPLPGLFRDFRLPLFLSQLALFLFFAFSGKRFATTGFAEESPAGAGSPAGIA
jgi:hypothetical protein